MKKLVIVIIAIAVAIFSAVTGYGIKYSSSINGNRLDCKYLGASGSFSREYWYAENGVMGASTCPALDK